MHVRDEDSRQRDRERKGSEMMGAWHSEETVRSPGGSRRTSKEAFRNEIGASRGCCLDCRAS